MSQGKNSKGNDRPLKNTDKPGNQARTDNRAGTGNQAGSRRAGGTAAGASGASGRTGKAKVLHILYVVLTVLSAIIVLGYIIARLAIKPPDVSARQPDFTRPPMTTQVRNEETGELMEIEIPSLSADRKEQFYTFLLIGVSQETGGGLTDTMMLAAYDVPNQKLSIMSLPRDTYVNYSGTRLLNSVYVVSGGDKDGKGVDGLRKAVQQLTGVYPDFYAVVQWEALGELVDAIGGVEFDVPFDMYYNDLSQHFKIDLKKGKQLLDGKGAMGLIRWRHNSDDAGHISSTYGYREGDIGRIKTQQDFLKATIKKCLQPGVLLPNLPQYLEIFQKNVTTNLTVGEMSYFAQSAVTGLDMDGLSLSILPYVEAGNGHLLPVGSQIVKAVNQSFNPYEEDIRLGELKLATQDDLPRSSESPDPEDEEEDPENSRDPQDSASPSPEEDDVVLPPGVIVRPNQSPSPSGSPKPTESGAPGGLVRPGESPKPSGSPAPSGSPKPSESPAPSSSPKPSESPAPSASPKASEAPGPGGSLQMPGAEPSATPKPSSAPATMPPLPNDDDEPLLPPGV